MILDLTYTVTIEEGSKLSILKFETENEIQYCHLMFDDVEPQKTIFRGLICYLNHLKLYSETCLNLTLGFDNKNQSYFDSQKVLRRIVMWLNTRSIGGQFVLPNNKDGLIDALSRFSTTEFNSISSQDAEVIDIFADRSRMISCKPINDLSLIQDFAKNFYG